MKQRTGFKWSLGMSLMVLIGLTVVASPATAQDARQTDVSVGYLNVNGSMNGWYTQLSSPLTRRWRLVGQLDGSHGPDPGSDEPSYTDFAVLGGVRFGWQPTAKISPFWQVLAGGLHSAAEAYDYSTILGVRHQEEFTVNYSVLQPGGGVTVMVTPRLGIRAQAEVQFAFHDEGLSFFPRVLAGGVIRLGR